MRGFFGLAGTVLAFAWVAWANPEQEIPVQHVLLPVPSACSAAADAPVRLPLQLRVYASDRDAAVVAEQLKVLNAQGVLTGLSLTRNPEEADVLCTLTGTGPGEKEAYELRLERAGKTGGRGVLRLNAAFPQGLFYAWQSTVQALEANRTENGFCLPGFAVSDRPLYAWRGVMLDVSRHFFTVEEVKRMIDAMSLFKLNRLHLHLTDGPGWRMEIKKYPRLTSVGAWRVPSAKGEWNWREIVLAAGERDPKATYGGFYTQEQMREIVAHAQSRQVTVVPEIDLPGHAYAAMHAYADLICDGVDFPVEGKRGNDTICLGRPETMRFVRDVIDELKTVFPPGTPIHLGHDEVAMQAWKKCRYCRRKLEELNEVGCKVLQRDFLRRIAACVREGGYEAIVWDEGAELDADQSLFVMAWRGNDHAAAAAAKGHPVILSPCSHLYFDYYQSASPKEPKAVGGLIPLKQVYGYRAPELPPERRGEVRGLQANIWTEYLGDMESVEYMMWPRALALAERAWSEGDPEDYPSFLARSSLALRLLEKLAVRYRPLDEPEE